MGAVFWEDWLRLSYINSGLNCGIIGTKDDFFYIGLYEKVVFSTMNDLYMLLQEF